MNKYIFFLTIIPFIAIPSAYGVGYLPQDEGFDSTASAVGATCPTTVGGILDLTANPLISRPGSATNGRCYVGIMEYPISGIPNNADIYSIQWQSDVTVVGAGSQCDIVQMDTSIYDLSSEAHPQHWNNVTSNTAYVDDTDFCDNPSAGKQSPKFGPLAIDDFETHMATDDIFTFGVRNHDYNSRNATDHRTDFANNILLVKYSFGDAVDDLIAVSIRGTQVDLSWGEPLTSVESVTGYNINYTTPHNENVATVAIANTSSTVTTYTVSGLTGSTPYSLRVGTMLETVRGNFSGNVLNITTGIDPTATFTPGTFNLTDTGTDLRDIRFEEIRLSDTDTRLNVTFPTAFTNLRCDIDYEFAQINRTYSNLNSVADPDNPGYNETSFRFNNVTNEIITTFCWNNQDGNGTYLITQRDVPFINQIDLFQSGEFGTMGQFGAIDLVALMVFGIIATMGFNRKNEAVGAVFLFALTVGLAWFGLITIPTAMGGVIAIVILIVIIQVRKE